jgi:hypothetical protein
VFVDTAFEATPPALAVAEPPAAPPETVAPDTTITEADFAIPLAMPEPTLSTPEPELAARALPHETDRPYPPTRRAIFFDVENTSRAEHIARVIDHLAVDRLGQRTEFFAVGNWKVIGPDTARLLSHHGAQLVHSAPVTGVRDWSDLRIAVTAGVWLAGARPGDVVEIVSNDRAFDAVGDVAAGLGIAFRRLSYQALPGLPAVTREAPSFDVDTADDRPRRRRRGRRRGGRTSPGAPPYAAASHAPHRPPAEHRRSADHPRPPEPVPVPEAPRALDELAGLLAPPPSAPSGNGAEPESPHTAPHDEIVAIVRDLIERTPSRRVSIDALANSLKMRGFRRTPGSPRLITRLRRIKEVHLSPAGIITLSPEYEAHDAEPPIAPVEMPSPAEEAVVSTPAEDADEDRQPDVTPTGEPIEAAEPPRDRRRRGGRGRRGRGGRGGTSSRRAPVSSS